MAGTSSDHHEINWEQADAAISGLRNLIACVEDFPKPGITFRDICPIFQVPKAVSAVVDLIVAYIDLHHADVDAIAALEARGFMFGPMIACSLEKPFVPIRKKGKLPGKVTSAPLTKEYGEDVIEIQDDSIKPGAKVVIVDDLLATGGTLASAIQLVNKVGGNPIGAICLVELPELCGRQKLSIPFHSFIQF